MVLRVADRAFESSYVKRVIVATDCEEIKRVVEGAGFEARLTPSDCASGTDRVALVARDLDEKIIVNLQGDEPMLSGDCISAAIELIAEGKAQMGSCMASFTDEAQYLDPSQVKVLVDDANFALLFSRVAIPYRQNNCAVEELFASPYLGRHLGLYSYDREFLLQFSELTPVFLEKVESLEQLRALHHGFKIAMARVESEAFGINTPEELERAQKFFT